MRKTISGILIFSILLCFFIPFPTLALDDTDGEPAEEVDSTDSTRLVLASSAGVYADPSLSGEPFRVLEKDTEVSIVSDTGKTVVTVRVTDDDGEQRVGYMGRSSFETVEAWPGETVRQYVTEACVRIGLMNAEIRYEDDEFLLSRYRAEIKNLYRQRSRQTEKTDTFSDLLLRSLREVGLVSDDSFASAEDIANWAVSRDRNVIVWDGEETIAANDMTDRAQQLTSSNVSAQQSRASTGNNDATVTIDTSDGVEVQAKFTAYFPFDDEMEGGFHDALGNMLDPSKNTCAAPASVPFGTQITVQGTGTWADGQIYTVTDRGGAITIEDGVYHFDILMSTAEECYAWGVKTGTAIISGDVIPISSLGLVKGGSVTIFEKILRFAGNTKAGFPIGVDSIVKYQNKFDSDLLDSLEPGDVLLLNNPEEIIPYTANGQLYSQTFFSKESDYCINEGVPRLYSGFDKVLIYVGKGVSGEHLVLESDDSVPENVNLTALGSERVASIRMVIRPTGCAQGE